MARWRYIKVLRRNEWQHLGLRRTSQSKDEEAKTTLVGDDEAGDGR